MEHLRLPVAGHLVAWIGNSGRAVLDHQLRLRVCGSDVASYFHMLAAWGRREVLLARLSGKTAGAWPPWPR